ncbi:sensor histidine kinase [Actinoplanes sp. NPDC051494]|uniref:sensor histidine kinase n=1 Tax=Actinoplanes sp. NPDC051494 TaxID=3363907 RepID=UPI00379B767B
MPEPRRPSRVSPLRSVRARAVFAAAVVTAVLGVTGGLWARHLVYKESLRDAVTFQSPITYGPSAGPDPVEVHLAAPEQDASLAVAALDRVLIPAVPAVVVLSALVAWYATRRALRPVEVIRARTAQVTASNPGDRVTVPRAHDEIAALAVTINDTLARLQQAGEAQRRLVGDAAHELRSPLAVLQAGLDVALTYPDDADWPATVATAARQARRLTALADDLLVMARLDAGAAPGAAASAVDVPATVARVAGESAVLRDDVRVEHPDGRPLLVLLASASFERVLRNLLDNAVRHAAERVVIRVDSPAARLRISVSDDGPGIPAADRDRVFERFTRLDHARGRDDGGTGLGLAIARELARRLGGDLVLTDHPGPGATFVLDIPAEDLDEDVSPRRG